MGKIEIKEIKELKDVWYDDYVLDCLIDGSKLLVGDAHECYVCDKKYIEEEFHNIEGYEDDTYNYETFGDYQKINYGNDKVEYYIEELDDEEKTKIIKVRPISDIHYNFVEIK